MESSVPTVGHKRVKPSVYLRPIAQPNSNSPAMIGMLQFITRLLWLIFDVCRSDPSGTAPLYGVMVITPIAEGEKSNDAPLPAPSVSQYV